MSTYRIINTTTVKFGKYDDVLRVMAKREKGFWASLFSSGDTQFVIVYSIIIYIFAFVNNIKEVE